MVQKALSVEELRDSIHRGEASDPLIFLESVMNGHDPRKLSAIFKLVLDIDEFSEGEPDKDDWASVVELVKKQFKYHHVSMSESTSAANTLAQYLHAKRKHVDTITHKGNDGNPNNDPLTEEEIVLFKEVFNDEF